MLKSFGARKLRGVAQRLIGGGRAEPIPGESGQRAWRVSVGDVTYVLGDVGTSSAVEGIATELGRDPYDFADIDFAPGDVVLDVGAHVGYLRAQGYSIDRLVDHCSAQMGRRHVRVTGCAMAEG